jgi:uncharacterized protein
MDNTIDNKIIEFIDNHHVLTLATCIDNKPWCSNCFYAYCHRSNVFIFTSDATTRHIQHAVSNENVAASIVLETKTVGKIQGLQIEGKLKSIDETNKSEYKSLYLKTFPFAILKQAELWILDPTTYKLTDNRLGFGKKIYWNK